MNQHTKAKEAIEQALNLSKQYNINKYSETLYYNNGLVSHARGDYLEGRRNFLRALKLIKSKKKFTHAIIMYRSLIIDLLLLKDTNMTMKYIKEAKEYCTTATDYKILDLFTADVYFLQGEYNEYESLMKTAIDFLYKDNITRYITFYSSEFADYYSNNRKYKKASYYYQVSMESYDKRYSNELNKYDGFIQLL